MCVLHPVSWNQIIATVCSLLPHQTCLFLRIPWIVPVSLSFPCVYICLCVNVWQIQNVGIFAHELLYLFLCLCVFICLCAWKRVSPTVYWVFMPWHPCVLFPGRKNGDGDKTYDTLDLPKRTEPSKGKLRPLSLWFHAVTQSCTHSYTHTQTHRKIYEITYTIIKFNSRIKIVGSAILQTHSKTQTDMCAY